jgi:hypothetical protein
MTEINWSIYPRYRNLITWNYLESEQIKYIIIITLTI